MNIPLNIDWQQILLHMFNLVLLLGILYFLLYKPVLQFMQKRNAEYEAEEEAIARKHQEADQLKKQYEDQLKTIDTEIEQRRHASMDRIKEEKEHALEETRQQSAELLKKAREQAEHEREKILQDAQDTVTVLVRDLAQKMVFLDTNAAYEEFLKDAESEVAGAMQVSRSATGEGEH